MNHSFNVDIAVEFGIEEAVFLENLVFWLEKNKANNRHIHDGKVWTYNSQKALSELFPYINRSKIQRVLDKLKKLDIIEKGNFNKVNYDRTTWYTLTEKGYSLYNLKIPIVQNEQSNVQNEQSNVQNEQSNVQNEQPIPDINTFITPDIISDVINNWNNKSNKKIRSIKFKRLKNLENLIKSCGLEEFYRVFDKINESDYLKNSSFDWIIQPEYFTKVLEGFYKDDSTFNKKKKSVTNFKQRTDDISAKDIKDKIMNKTKNKNPLVEQGQEDSYSSEACEILARISKIS